MTELIGTDPGIGEGGRTSRLPEPTTTRNALVIVASTRASTGIYADETGPIIAEWLSERGWESRVAVMPDGCKVGQSIAVGIDDVVDLVITTGGTGLSPTDSTPEETRPFIQREVPGLADAIRASGGSAVPTSILNRGLAGISGKTLIVNLPGSRGGVRDGLGVLSNVLDHILDQLSGGDHERQDPGFSDPVAGTSDTSQSPQTPDTIPRQYVHP